MVLPTAYRYKGFEVNLWDDKLYGGSSIGYSIYRIKDGLCLDEGIGSGIKDAKTNAEFEIDSYFKRESKVKAVEFIDNYMRKLERRIERHTRILKAHEEKAGDTPLDEYYNYFGGYSEGYRKGVMAFMEDTIDDMEELKKNIRRGICMKLDRQIDTILDQLKALHTVTGKDLRFLQLVQSLEYKVKEATGKDDVFYVENAVVEQVLEEWLAEMNITKTMTIQKLRNVIEQQGFRTGFDSETHNLIVMSQGYQKLGEIDSTKQFDVDMNKHFQRVATKEQEKAIYNALFQFVETPIEQRDGGVL